MIEEPCKHILEKVLHTIKKLSDLRQQLGKLAGFTVTEAGEFISHPAIDSNKISESNDLYQEIDETIIQLANYNAEWQDCQNSQK